jgi:hypothetical protein
MASLLITINRPSFGFDSDLLCLKNFTPLHEQSFRIKEIISNIFPSSEYTLTWSDDLKNVYLKVSNNSEDNTQLLNYLNDSSSSIFTDIQALYENTDVSFKSEFIE